ncbi:MAG: hypothetical protein MZU97_09460 [Bacillus subtilis]|nr:hypothetical protein [Bacillus subtilis]
MNDGVLGQYLKAAVTEERREDHQAVQDRQGHPRRIHGSDEGVRRSLPGFADGRRPESDLSAACVFEGRSGSAIPLRFRRLAESQAAFEFFDPAQLTDIVRNKTDNLAYVYGRT